MTPIETAEETETMGRVVVEAKIENLKDLWDAERGIMAVVQARQVTVNDALADTGSWLLSLPRRFIVQLGLKPVHTRQTLMAVGVQPSNLYEAVRLTVQERFCTVDVLEVPDQVPVLIGQVPLEIMDWVVDPKNRRLIGNPAHGGQQIIEML